jgi:hypothetical protein
MKTRGQIDHCDYVAGRHWEAAWENAEIGGVRAIDPGREAVDFVADYDVIDDVPVPTLDDRKADLLGIIRGTEAAALARIISPGRERMLSLDLNAVYANPETDRTDADRGLLAKAADIAARKQAIQRHGVGLEIEVEELTEATINGWTPAPFPQV